MSMFLQRFFLFPLLDRGQNAVNILFDGIVFPKLGFQCLAQPGTHAGVQYTANANLTHLGGFQYRG